MSTEDAPEVDDTTADVVDTEPEAELADGVEEDAPESDEAETEDTEEESEEEASGEEGSFTNLNPNDLPKELRPTYRNLMRDYTQKTQALAEARKQVEPLNEWAGFFETQGIDPASEDAPVEAFLALAQAFEAQGADVSELLYGEGAEQEDSFDLDSLTDDDDPRVAALAQRLAQVEQSVSGMTEAEQQSHRDQVAVTHMGEQFHAIAEEMGVERLDDEYANLLVKTADLDSNGLPLLADAHDQLQKLTGARREKVKQSKQAPKTPPAGSPGREDYDATDPEAIRRHMLAIANR